MISSGGEWDLRQLPGGNPISMLLIRLLRGNQLAPSGKLISHQFRHPLPLVLAAERAVEEGLSGLDIDRQEVAMTVEAGEQFAVVKSDRPRIDFGRVKPSNVRDGAKAVDGKF